MDGIKTEASHKKSNRIRTEIENKSRKVDCLIIVVDGFEKCHYENASKGKATITTSK